MDNPDRQKSAGKRHLKNFYNFLAPRAFTLIIFGALLCILSAKFFHALRNGLLSKYTGWILADIAVLLAVELALSIICRKWHGKNILRSANVFAAIICTWAVINAGFLIRTGNQILPANLVTLLREPISTLAMVSVNLIKMPLTAAALLLPAAATLIFFFYVLAKPKPPKPIRKNIKKKFIIVLLIIVVISPLSWLLSKTASDQIAYAGLYDNCHLQAILSIIITDEYDNNVGNHENIKKTIPEFDRVQIIPPSPDSSEKQNIIIIVLEGVQYRQTSLIENEHNLTPHLASIAKQGIHFANARSSVTHTTKAIFSLLTGRFASASQNLVEAVPVEKPYPALPVILQKKLDYRSAFFQSAKGDFEARPALLHNLGFQKFWARDNLNDPNHFLGYLACDEFVMLEKIVKWIKQKKKPFLLTILCSVTHDPYEVPQWFAEPEKEPIERYRQSIKYTDKFIAELDNKLEILGIKNSTILCVVGDHGEAFGEHGLHGHERIAFEEVLRIPWVIRAPKLIEKQKTITKPVASVDLTPTLLKMLGFNIEKAGFDGINVLQQIPKNRKVFFAGWMTQGPAGYVQKNKKYIYNPESKTVGIYEIKPKAKENFIFQFTQKQSRIIAQQIINWRKSTFFKPKQKPKGQKILFDSWDCYWNKRVKVQYLEKK